MDERGEDRYVVNCWSVTCIRQPDHGVVASIPVRDGEIVFRASLRAIEGMFSGDAGVVKNFVGGYKLEETLRLRECLCRRNNQQSTGEEPKEADHREQ